MLEGMTQSGFNYKIDKRVLDDWNFIELLSDAKEGDLSASIKAFRMLLGNEQYKSLKEHLTDSEGFLSSEKMSDTFVEIVESSEEVKK